MSSIASMTFHIHADYRERSKFEDIFSKHHPLLTVDWTNLHVGDFAVVNPADGSTVCILERKTLRDLASSVCDGRYREQKARMAAAAGATSTGYILEGRVDMGAATLDDLDPQMTTAVKTIMARLQLRDGMACFNTTGPTETAALLAHIAHLGDRLCAPKAAAALYSGTVRVKKADNVTPRLVAVQALMSITRVSSRIAEAVLDEFGADDLHSLMTALHTGGTDLIVQRLSDIKASGSKRMGAPLARTMLAALGIRPSHT